MTEEQNKGGLIVNTARSLGTAAGRIASLAGVSPGSDAIALLKKDHDKVKDLFEDFEKTEDREAKQRLAREALIELKVHAELEEELFYPALRQAAGDDLINEAGEEHHVVKLLIAELEQMGSADEHYDAKFKVLTENVRHHIREEEGEIFPRARSMDTDWEAVGEAMRRRKQELLAAGVPGKQAPKAGKTGHRKTVRRARRKKGAA